ncbi:MFS transporter [Propionibacterium freudenreichii]|uniref:MFS transporter n=1 Tax=Propionibacterium freudenreichii TaxID=1744 RepID=UPI0038554694
MSQPVSAPAVNEKDLIRKITLRIVPFVMVLYTIAYVDRSVIGFAKLHMAADIGLSDTAYGLGAGLFFLGYFLFEVPSNYVMPRFGARKWFTRILVTWGLVTMATALVPNATTFYIVRFLLGMAEAGFYPGILYYLTLWYPQRHRTKATGTFVLAAPLAFLIMSPLAGWMLGLDWFSLQGWHWMFLLCGGIAVIAAIPTLLLLHDTPEDAPWMSKAEVAWIEAELAKDKATLGQVEHKNPLAAMKSKYVWVFALLFFPSTVGVYGLSFWVPTVVHRFSGSDVATGWHPDHFPLGESLQGELDPAGRDLRGRGSGHRDGGRAVQPVGPNGLDVCGCLLLVLDCRGVLAAAHALPGRRISSGGDCLHELIRKHRRFCRPLRGGSDLGCHRRGDQWHVLPVRRALPWCDLHACRAEVLGGPQPGTTGIGQQRAHGRGGLAE